MVAIKRSGKLHLLLLDALGASLSAVGVGAALWLFLVHNQHTVSELRDYNQLISSATQDLAALRTARDRQQATLQDRQTELAAGGQLPSEISLEGYFQTLSRLAVQHRLRVVRHNPLTSRNYPGLLEQRYAYEVIGTMPDLARFFKAIEDAEFWADISYLKIHDGQPQGGDPTEERIASLTISLFSAATNEKAATGTG